MARHLTLEEREVISQMRARGESSEAIGRSLGRAPSTIGREIRRNRCGNQYWACHAQQLADLRRRRARIKSRKMNRPEIACYVKRHLREYWSPDQIAGRMRFDFPDNPRMRISHQTIYSWLSCDDHRRRWLIYLRRYRAVARRPRPGYQASRRIKDRPDVIEQRERYGDWEGDTIAGRYQTSAALLSLVERRSGYLELALVKDRTSASVQRVMTRRLRKYPAELRRSTTVDNGNEFARAPQLEKHSIAVYYADPYSPWQRGTNENTNGLARQFFPKGTSFADISLRKVQQVQDLLNDRPRKRLEYRTPSEIINQQRYRATQT